VNVFFVSEWYPVNTVICRPQYTPHLFISLQFRSPPGELGVGRGADNRTLKKILVTKTEGAVGVYFGWQKLLRKAGAYVGLSSQWWWCWWWLLWLWLWFRSLYSTKLSKRYIFSLISLSTLACLKMVDINIYTFKKYLGLRTSSVTYQVLTATSLKMIFFRVLCRVVTL
jgi:hypothetical protein